MGWGRWWELFLKTKIDLYSAPYSKKLISEVLGYGSTVFTLQTHTVHTCLHLMNLLTYIEIHQVIMYRNAQRTIPWEVDKFMGGGDWGRRGRGNGCSSFDRWWGLRRKWSIIANNRLCSFASCNRMQLYLKHTNHWFTFYVLPSPENLSPVSTTRVDGQS